MTNTNPITQTAIAIAAQLGETDSAPRATIWRTVRTLGPERAQAFVAQALDVEANGGMLVPDGRRWRAFARRGAAVPRPPRPGRPVAHHLMQPPVAQPAAPPVRAGCSC